MASISFLSQARLSANVCAIRAENLEVSRIHAQRRVAAAHQELLRAQVAHAAAVADLAELERLAGVEDHRR